MSSGKFFDIINRRYFYVISYRLLIKGMIISSITNVLFLVMGSYIFFSRGPHVYYATSGDSSPIQLTPLATPNYSATPLLADDIPGDVGPDINLLK